MKKFLLYSVVSVVVVLFTVITATAEESREIYIDDVLASNDEIKTQTVDYMKVIPVKSLSEYLGYEVTEEEDIITIKEGENCKNSRGC